jgi:hypothetical protein
MALKPANLMEWFIALNDAFGLSQRFRLPRWGRDRVEVSPNGRNRLMQFYEECAA